MTDPLNETTWLITDVAPAGAAVVTRATSEARPAMARTTDRTSEAPVRAFPEVDEAHEAHEADDEALAEVRFWPPPSTSTGSARSGCGETASWSGEPTATRSDMRNDLPSSEHR